MNRPSGPTVKTLAATTPWMRSTSTSVSTPVSTCSGGSMWKSGFSSDCANQPRSASLPRNTPDGVSYIAARNGDTNSMSSAHIAITASRSWRFHASSHRSTRSFACARSSTRRHASPSVTDHGRARRREGGADHRRRIRHRAGVGARVRTRGCARRGRRRHRSRRRPRDRRAHPRPRAPTRSFVRLRRHRRGAGRRDGRGRRSTPTDASTARTTTPGSRSCRVASPPSASTSGSASST